MMLIRQDSDSLYVINNGSKHRPVIATKHAEGDHVKGRHIIGTPSANIGGERWYDETYRTNQLKYDGLKYLKWEAGIY